MSELKKRATFGIILLFFSTSLPGGYWSHRTKSLKGKHVYLIQEGIKFRYLMIDSENDGILDLNKGRSCKFIFYRVGKDTVTITIEKDGIVKKVWKFTEKIKTFKVYLSKGKYRIRSNKPVRLRFYIWRNVRLKNLQPIGGGYPVTLQIGEKRYTYYRVAGDTVLRVRVRGKAKIWAYFRPDAKKKTKHKVYEIRILEDGKTIKRSKVRIKPSKRGRYLERKKITPGLPIRVPIYVGKGIHEYTIKVTKGTGYAKFYIEQSIKRKTPKNKKTSIKKRLGVGMSGGLINTVYPMLFGFLPTSKVLGLSTLGLSTELYYDSNPYKFSDESLKMLKTGTKEYLFPSVSTPRDLVLKMGLTPSIKVKNTEIRFKLIFYNHLRNLVKNSWVYGLEFSHRFSKRLQLGVGLYSRSETFIRPVYYSSLRGYPAVYPLSYEYRRINLWSKHLRLTPVLNWVRVSASYVKYKYNYPFDYLSGDRTGVEFLGRVKMKGFFIYPRVQISEYVASGRNPWESDYSHIAHVIDLQVTYKEIFIKPSVNIGIERRSFTTGNLWDKLHNGRVDIIRRFGIKIALPYSVSGLWFRVYYEQRRLSLPMGVEGIFKDYKRWTFGLIYTEVIKWD